MPIYQMLTQLIPTKSQWRSWTLPSRLTAIGTLVGVIGIVLTLILYAVDNVTEHGPDSHELALNLLKNANCGTLDSMKDTQQITDDITDTIKRALHSEGDIYKDAAITALQNNRPLEAADLFEKFAKLRSDKAQIMSKEAALDWVDVARIYELCDPRKAMFAYKQAADLDPHNATAWNGLGLLYMNVNHKAEDAFHKAIDNAGNNDDVLGAAYGNLGIVYTHLGDLGAAETSLRESLRIDETNDQRGAWQISILILEMYICNAKS